MAQTKLDKKKETFSISAPGASSVMLAGDFTSWLEKCIDLKKQKNGLWKATVPLAPGRYHYRFLVDGQWCNDPQAAAHEPNPFGSLNSVREVI